MSDYLEWQRDTVTRSRTDLSGMTCSATFSPCDAYRYRLSWEWGGVRSVPLVALMLNPSTATHEVLDPTVSGLIKRARVWGYGGVVVVNLFAFRATDPKDMRAAEDPIGPSNDGVIEHVMRHEVALRDGMGIAAWGKHGSHLGRADAVKALVSSTGATLHALAVNGDGSPKHPLYVSHALGPEPFDLAA